MFQLGSPDLGLRHDDGMSDIDATTAAIVLPSAGAALVAFGKLAVWFGNLWATLSREKVASEKETAALNRANDTRIADQTSVALNHLASRVDDHTVRDLASQAELKAAVVGFASKLDTIALWQERTPIGIDDAPNPATRPSIASERRRKFRPVPMKPTGHDD